MKEDSKRQIHVFTSAAINYLPKVRLLCESLKRLHPEFVIHVAIPDTIPDWLDLEREPFDHIIRVSDLGIPNEKGWIFQHSLVELSTAIKPFVLKQLFENTACWAAMYFDPDIVIFSRLDDLVGEFDTFSILLTPHLTHPDTSFQGVLDNEISALKHGAYNLGFIGVKNDNEGRRFANWWADRLYNFCVDRKAEGLFVDQKWIDLVPGFFNNVRIVTDSRFNVATWNIAFRDLVGDFSTGFTVDGKPLGFYHFTGFDSGAHEIMQKKYGGKNLAAATLVNWYKENAKSGLKAAFSPWAWGTFSNGEVITSQHRIVYRKRKDLQRVFPDPFQIEGEDNNFYMWFKARAEIEHRDIFTDLRNSTLSNEIRGTSREINITTRVLESVSKFLILMKRAQEISAQEGIGGVISRVRERLSGNRQT